MTAGARRGDRVVLRLPAGLDFVHAFYATQLAGAIPCPVSPALTGDLLARRMRLVRASLVLGDLSAFDERSEAAALPAVDLDDFSHFQITSGTSGEPRAAMITHRALAAYLQISHAFLDTTRADVMVGWVPPWHDLGLVYSVIGPVCWPCLCHIVTPAVRTIPEWLATLARVGGTITGAPDFAYRIASRTVDPRGLDLRRLRHATNGGEPVRWETIENFERRFDCAGVVRPGYGLAEATLGVTCVRPRAPLRRGANGAVSCGPPLPAVEVRIVDERGALSPRGETGEILVRTPALFSGYFEAEDETRRALVDGWLHTGDIGATDEHGELFVLGRRRSMIKRGGAVVAPREIEEAAERVPEVRLSAAIGLARERGADRMDAGEEVVLVTEVEPATTDRAALAARVASAVRQAMGWVPAEILLLKPRAIPRTENGKVRHLGLRRAITTGELARDGHVLWGDAERWREAGA